MHFQIASAAHETAAVLPGSFAGLKGAGTQAESAPAKAVSIEPKPTIFYPIGWMAITAVAVWFTWLALG